jgi:hypothetical protein
MIIMKIKNNIEKQSGTSAAGIYIVICIYWKNNILEKNIGKNQALALPGSPLFNLLGGALFGVPVGFVLK